MSHEPRGRQTGVACLLKIPTPALSGSGTGQSAHGYHLSLPGENIWFNDFILRASTPLRNKGTGIKTKKHKIRKNLGVLSGMFLKLFFLGFKNRFYFGGYFTETNTCCAGFFTMSAHNNGVIIFNKLAIAAVVKFNGF